MKFTDDAVALKSANELAEILDEDSESEKESFIVPESLPEHVRIDGKSPRLETTEQRLGTSEQTDSNN